MSRAQRSTKWCAAEPGFLAGTRDQQTPVASRAVL